MTQQLVDRRTIREERGISENQADSIFRKISQKYGCVRIPGHRRVWVTREHYERAFQEDGRNQSGSASSDSASGRMV